VICTLIILGHIFTFKHLCLHSITKILRNGPKAHFPFIGVDVDGEVVGRRSSKEPEVGSATEVPQDPLHSSEMWLPRGVHMVGHMLDDVCDVGLGEDEVLQRPNKTLVVGGISHRGPSLEALP
jgi:hypothetical protein